MSFKFIPTSSPEGPTAEEMDEDYDDLDLGRELVNISRKNCVPASSCSTRAVNSALLRVWKELVLPYFTFYYITLQTTSLWLNKIHKI